MGVDYEPVLAIYLPMEDPESFDELQEICDKLADLDVWKEPPRRDEWEPERGWQYFTAGGVEWQAGEMNTVVGGYMALFTHLPRDGSGVDADPMLEALKQAGYPDCFVQTDTRIT